MALVFPPPRRISRGWRKRPVVFGLVLCGLAITGWAVFSVTPVVDNLFPSLSNYLAPINVAASSYTYPEGIDMDHGKCEPSSWNEGEDYVIAWWHNSVHVTATPHLNYWVDDGVLNYQVPAGEWVALNGSLGVARHWQPGKQASDCSDHPTCPSGWEAWHERGNENQKFQWSWQAKQGQPPEGDHISEPEEELMLSLEPPGTYQVDPESCECPHYRCHTEQRLWLQMPIPDDVNPTNVIEVEAWRFPTAAFETHPSQTVHLHVVDQRESLQRTFQVSDWSLGAGFDETTAEEWVEQANEWLNLSAEPLRGVDTDHDGWPDEHRGQWDRHVSKKFLIDHVAEVDPWPNEYKSVHYGEDFYVSGTGTVTIENDMIVSGHITNRDVWWKNPPAGAETRTVAVVSKILYVVDNNNTETLEGFRAGGVGERPGRSIALAYGSNIKADEGTLLHEWGHNVGLYHVADPTNPPDDAYELGHKKNHMYTGPGFSQTRDGWVSGWPLELEKGGTEEQLLKWEDFSDWPL